VGRGFHDHPLLGGCVWEYRRPEAPRNSGANCTFWWKSRSDLPSPDLQPYQLDFPYASEITAQQFEMPEHGWSIAVGLDQPQSRGTVRLASADWRDEPILDPRFLSEQADVDALKVAVELCREIGNAPEMAEFVKREVMPGPLKGAALETFIRNACNTYWHQVGSCRMGRDAMAVVDGTLKVYGVEGLRVADGSIMPRIATGNTMVPCMLIGERMAEILA
jgi:choline dehydrogenase